MFNGAGGRKDNDNEFRYFWTDASRNSIIVDPVVEELVVQFVDPDGKERSVPMFVISGTTDEDVKEAEAPPQYKYKVEIPMLRGPIVGDKQRWMCLSCVREDKDEAIDVAVKGINQHFLLPAKERNDSNYERMFSWEETNTFQLPPPPPFVENPASFSKSAVVAAAIAPPPTQPSPSSPPPPLENAN